MEKVLNKLLRISLAASCTLSLVVPNVIRAQDTQASEELARADVYPKPQVLEYLSDEGMKLEGTVNLVVHGEQNPATIQKIKDLLKSENIAFVESDEVKNDQANILISSDKEHCDTCADDVLAGDAKVLEETQGYILNASNDVNTKGDVTIVGSDEDGAYYGVMTLTQMMEQETSDGRMAEATVSDYPDVKLRGFVEGFYGYPWSYEDRLSLMSESSKYKMNTYIYAPKDDPYHKDQWRTLYPADKAEELRKLAEEGKKDNMSFCWSAHPGYGFNYNTEDDYNALIRKFQQLYDLGVRQFGISYDDLGGTPSGKNHANLINKVNRNFVQAKGDVKPLIVVGTQYCRGWGPGMIDYFKPFFSALDEDVVVMWTGDNTMSAITKDAYDWPKQQTGVDRNLAAWWNYPVNDYCDGNLMMSPLENLDNDVDNLAGFFLNPMSQAEASKVAIFSGADYSWNIGDFERTSSWKRAIKELVPEANEVFERFADNVSFVKDGFEFDESRYLVPHLEALTKALQTNEGVLEAAQTLKTDFETMKADAAVLRKIENQGLLEEIQTHVNAYEVLAEAGIEAMNGFIAADNGDLTGCKNQIVAYQELLAKTETFKVDSLESNGTKSNVVKVGEKRIKPMLRDAASQMQAHLMTVLAPEDHGAVSGSIEGLDKKELVLAQGNYKVTDINGVLEVDDDITIRLPKAMRVSSIQLTAADASALTIQYSLNGLTWTTAGTEENEAGLKAEIDAAAAYVKVINMSDAAKEIHMESLEVFPVYNIGEVKATTDLTTYQNYKISNVVDGTIRNKFYSSAGATVGSFIRVDLGKAIPLFDVQAYFAVNPKGVGVDGFAATKLEISIDGVTWTQIGDIIEDENYVEKTVDGQILCAAEFNAEGAMARYIRFSATESSGNWVQVYEIPYNKTVSNLGDDTITLIDSTIESGNAQNLYDKDLTTAFSPNAIKDNDTVTYAMTTISNVDTLTIIQDKNAISNAVVSVQDLEGNWTDVGTLDQELNVIDVKKGIQNVKLTFSGENPTPVIYEIIVKERVKENTAFFKSLMKTLLDKTTALMNSDQFSKLAPNVQAMIKVRYEEAVAVYEEEYATLLQCQDAWKNLADAMHYADFVADKAELKKLIDECEAIDTGKYTEESVAAFEEALATANDVYADPNALQERIDATYNALSTAKNGLREEPVISVDKSVLSSMIDTANKAMNEQDKYLKNAAWYVFVEALANAEAVFTNEAATQAEVNKAVSELSNAYLNIRYAPSEEMLKQLEDFINYTKNINRALYSAKDLKAIDDAANKAQSMLENKDFDKTEFTAFANTMGEIMDIIDHNKIEKPADKDQNKNDGKQNGVKAPGTSDKTNAAGMFLMTLLAGCGLLVSKKRKETK